MSRSLPTAFRDPFLISEGSVGSRAVSSAPPLAHSGDTSFIPSTDLYVDPITYASRSSGFKRSFGDTQSELTTALTFSSEPSLALASLGEPSAKRIKSEDESSSHLSGFYPSEHWSHSELTTVFSRGLQWASQPPISTMVTDVSVQYPFGLFSDMTLPPSTHSGAKLLDTATGTLPTPSIASAMNYSFDGTTFNFGATHDSESIKAETYSSTCVSECESGLYAVAAAASDSSQQDFVYTKRPTRRVALEALTELQHYANALKREIEAKRSQLLLNHDRQQEIRRRFAPKVREECFGVKRGDLFDFPFFALSALSDPSGADEIAWLFGHSAEDLVDFDFSCQLGHTSKMEVKTMLQRRAVQRRSFPRTLRSTYEPVAEMHAIENELKCKCSAIQLLSEAEKHKGLRCFHEMVLPFTKSEMEAVNKLLTVFFYNRMTLFSCVSSEGHCQAADDSNNDDNNNAVETDFFSEMNEVLFPTTEDATVNELEGSSLSLIATANDQLDDFLSANTHITRAQITSKMRPFAKEIVAFGVTRYSGEIPWKEVAQSIKNGRTALELQKAWRFNKYSTNPLAKSFHTWTKKETTKLKEICGSSYKHDWEQVATTVMGESDDSRGKTALRCLQKCIGVTNGKHFDGLRKGAFSKEELDALRKIVRQLPLSFRDGNFWAAAAERLGTRTPIQVYHVLAEEYPNEIPVFEMQRPPKWNATVSFKSWLLADIYALKPDCVDANKRMTRKRAKTRGGHSSFGLASRHLCHFGGRRIREMVVRNLAEVLATVQTFVGQSDVCDQRHSTEEAEVAEESEVRTDASATS